MEVLRFSEVKIDRPRPYGLSQFKYIHGPSLAISCISTYHVQEPLRYGPESIGRFYDESRSTRCLLPSFDLNRAPKYIENFDSIDRNFARYAMSSSDRSFPLCQSVSLVCFWSKSSVCFSIWSSPLLDGLLSKLVTTSAILRPGEGLRLSVLVSGVILFVSICPLSGLLVILWRPCGFVRPGALSV